jgi:hypothetical protein
MKKTPLHHTMLQESKQHAVSPVKGKGGEGEGEREERLNNSLYINN